MPQVPYCHFQHCKLYDLIDCVKCFEIYLQNCKDHYVKKKKKPGWMPRTEILNYVLMLSCNAQLRLSCTINVNVMCLREILSCLLSSYWLHHRMLMNTIDERGIIRPKYQFNVEAGKKNEILASWCFISAILFQLNISWNTNDFMTLSNALNFFFGTRHKIICIPAYRYAFPHEILLRKYGAAETSENLGFIFTVYRHKTVKKEIPIKLILMKLFFV